MKLSNIILEDLGSYSKFKTESQELENEMKGTYNRDDINVTIGQYHQRDRGFGSITIRSKEEVVPAEYANMKNFLTAKGYEITGVANFADDDGDRYFYPTIKFEFDI